MAFDLLAQILSRIKIGLSKFKFLFNISYDLYEIVSTEIRQIYNGNGTNNYLKIFSPKMDVIALSLEEIENISHEELKDKMIIDSHIINSNKRDAVKSLANLYAFTFTEKGHLRRLLNLLDDKDYEIQQIGVDSLIKVVNIILRNSNEKKLLKSISSSQKNKDIQSTG